MQDFGRSGLLNSGFDGGSLDTMGNSHIGNSDDLTPESFRTRQQQIIEEQDKGLDVLHQVIQRQKMMGNAIGDELDYHNDLIDEINDSVDSTRQKLIRTEAKTKQVTKKVGSCAMFVVIVLLLITIVVVGVVPT